MMDITQQPFAYRNNRSPAGGNAPPAGACFRVPYRLFPGRPTHSFKPRGWATTILCTLLLLAITARSQAQTVAPQMKHGAATNTVSLSNMAAHGPPTVLQASAMLVELATAHEARRQQIIRALAAMHTAQLIPALRAYQNGLLFVQNGKAVVFGTPIISPSAGKLFPMEDALTLQPVQSANSKPILLANLPDNLLTVHDRDADLLSIAIHSMQLYSTDIRQRRRAVISLGNSHDLRYLPELQSLLARGGNGVSARILKESINRIVLATGTPRQQVAAARALGTLHSTRAEHQLKKTMRRAAKAKDTTLASACAASLGQISSYQRTMRILFNSFAGLSLSSIYILMALGLAIIFGLMGVINMAQGEFMAIGAFTTLVVSNIFKTHFPAEFNWYMAAAIPMAFLVSGALGWLVEATLIRRLYGRPLETLLCTWGLSLVLIEAIRLVFGNNNSLTPPSWLTGGWRVMPGLVLPMNRLFIISFCALCIALLYLLVGRTKLGLLIRATTQDRTMAEALGVRTRRIDGMTFALGSGLAGMAGCTVPLFDKINPGMGQSYIVDSFLVVVVGGVGNLAGVIFSGLGLGFVEKYIEPLTHPVYAKIIVLILVIIFLQWRPSGLFPARGRSID